MFVPVIVVVVVVHAVHDLPNRQVCVWFLFSFLTVFNTLFQLKSELDAHSFLLFRAFLFHSIFILILI